MFEVKARSFRSIRTISVRYWVSATSLLHTTHMHMECMAETKQALYNIP
jgi:hypothetical protein